MYNLESRLTKFKNISNFEYNGKKYLTNTKHIGKEAYLNIIFPPASDEVQQKIDKVELPDELREFYRQYNGAKLFQDLLSIDGFLPDSYLLARDDHRKLPPYNIEDSNSQFGIKLRRGKKIVFASYGYDRSLLVIDKRSGKVYCSEPDKINKIKAEWNSFSEWFDNELKRFSTYFNENGKLLTAPEITVPAKK